MASNNISSRTPEYVQLTLGRIRLLLPQAELLSLVTAPEIGPAGNGGSIGTIKVNDAVLPVYNFDEQLQLLSTVQGNRSACACLDNGKTAFGILCDKAEIVDGAGMSIVGMPVCMLSANAPVQSLAVQGTRILCISNTDRIAGLIG